MKKLLGIISMLLFSWNTYGQTTISIKLDAGGEDATIDDFNQAQNNPNEVEYFSGSWTIGGTAVTWRNFFKFDFSVFPANAVIQSAQLNLYFAPLNNFSATDTSLTNSNESVLQRVTGSWSENAVTWNNQPATTSQNQVVLPASISPTQDYLMTDVTALVQDIISSGSNDGFMLRLQNETPYARLIFASGDYPDSSLHPELIITYTLCNTYVMDDNGEDATIDTYNPGNNYPNEIELDSEGWTINGTAVTWRSLLKFDFTTIPANAIINSAHLSLFYADTNNFGNAMHSSLTHSNESVILRVLDPWSENQVTWNNQPGTTTSNQVLIPQSVTGYDDYIGLDVTGQIQDMMSAPNGNQGFMIRLTDETYYAQMLFASGDNPHLNKHPSLEVCYSIPTGLQNNISSAVKFQVYPNPSTGEFNILSDNILSVRIYNSIGELIYQNEKVARSANSLQIDLDHSSPGIYFVIVNPGPGQLVQKIIIQ